MVNTLLIFRLITHDYPSSLSVLTVNIISTSNNFQKEETLLMSSEKDRKKEKKVPSRQSPSAEKRTLKHASKTHRNTFCVRETSASRNHGRLRS